MTNGEDGFIEVGGVPIHNWDGGAWDAGPATQMLEASRLERAYGCAWRESGGVWVAA